MTLSFRSVSVVCIACALGAVAHGQTAIITKARAFLGTEAALDAVKSVHYVGTMEAVDPTDPNKKTNGTIEIIFQKPDRHRIVVTSDKTIETTSLDGYEGWQRVRDVKDPAKWRQTIATVEQIRRLRANTWENLSFFRGIETRGGRIEVMDPVTVDGVMTNKLAFIYAPNIIFYRYFDQNTGKLVMSETEAGSQIREEGEIKVDGVRFPKKIVTTTKASAGKVPVITITFESIKLNENFPDDLFKMPALNEK